MKKCYIFTFGVGQLMSKYVIKIYGTYEGARQRMVEQFGKCWCCQYTEDEFEKEREGYFKDITVLEV